MQRRFSTRFGFVAGLALALASPSFARAEGVLPAAATAAQREQAQSRFAHGKQLLDSGHSEEALDEFRASYAIVASPNTRLQIARALRADDRLLEAYAEFGRTAVEAKELAVADSRYEKAYKSAVAERAALESKLGFVTLTITNPTEDTRVMVGTDELARGGWGQPAPLQVGTTEIEVRTPGHKPVHNSVTVGPGQS